VGEPERCVQIGLKPVVRVIEAAGLLVFVGFQRIVGWGRDGLAWESGRLSWEGVRVTGVEGWEMRGFGWDLVRDLEVEFILDLRSGAHVGGGYVDGPNRTTPR